MIINGASVVSPERIPTEDVDVLAHLVFMIQFIRNYENSQMVKNMVESEEKYRKRASLGLFRRVIANAISMVGASEIKELSMLIDARELTAVNIDPVIEKKSFLEKLLTTVDQKRILIYKFAPRFIRIEEELTEIVDRVDDVARRGHNTLSVLPAIESKVADETKLVKEKEKDNDEKNLLK